MKFCRFQFDGRARYGLVETFGGAESITQLLNAPPQDSGSEEVTSTTITPVALNQAQLLRAGEHRQLFFSVRRRPRGD